MYTVLLIIVSKDLVLVPQRDVNNSQPKFIFLPDTLINEAVTLCPTGRQSRSALLTDAQVKKHTQPFYGPFFPGPPG